MTKNKNLILPAVLLGLVLVVVGVIYIVEPAHSLPSFFPGHQSGSNHHHIKHGIAALAVAAGSFILAWFQTEPASSKT